MRGFRIKFRSEEIVVTPDFRSSVTIFYSSSNGSSPTCVKKLDPNPLKLSEKQKQQMLDEYLKDFYLLEAQLKKKGVL